jgi:hypothetical protein
MQELFGGDLDETTNVLLDGDVTTPRGGQRDARRAGADGGHRRTCARTAGSRRSLARDRRRALAADPQLGEQLAALGFTGEGFAPTPTSPGDLRAGPAGRAAAASRACSPRTRRPPDVVATTAGQERRRRCVTGCSTTSPRWRGGPQATIVSENLMFEEALDALTDSQTRGIVITLVVALLVLVAFFGSGDRRRCSGSSR